MSDVEYIKSFFKIHSDFPKNVRSVDPPCFSPLRPFQGLRFCDILPILRNPLAFEALITHLVHHIVSETIPTSPNKRIDVVIGLDARGFLLGPVIALRLGAAFVPVRKRGKLPGECSQAAYEKEYGMVRPNFTSLPHRPYFLSRFFVVVVV
jgi:adenine phosphoribosyltransferase